jgi:hypothetical protein
MERQIPTGFTGKGTQFDMMGQEIGEWVNPRLLPE